MITESQALEVIRLRSEGNSQHEISELVGIVQSSVSHICTGKLFPDLYRPFGLAEIKLGPKRQPILEKDSRGEHVAFERFFKLAKTLPKLPLQAAAILAISAGDEVGELLAKLAEV
jgi:hypothetical protein